MSLHQFLFLNQYDLNLTTWVYLSSLLIIGIYFKFGRVWSVRNLDLILLLMLAPGMLLLEQGAHWVGYIWLFSAGGAIFIRLLIDPILVRRPLLEPNLSTGGLTFTGIAMLVFLLMNVVTGKTPQGDTGASISVSASANASAAEILSDHQKARYPSLGLLHKTVEKFFSDPNNPDNARNLDGIQSKLINSLSIACYFAIVLGMVVIGYLHYGNTRTGIAAAALYLLVPYTAYITKVVHLSLDHVLPSSLLVWGIVLYRRPFLSGCFLGLAAGTILHPLFLLPLWISFYWQRGMLRFTLGALAALICSAAGWIWVLGGYQEVMGVVTEIFAFSEKGTGFWSEYDPFWRIPVLTAFVLISLMLSIWPPRKNLGTLLSCSAALMLGVQFWLPQGGGLYINWYLPLLLMTFFRPNLEDRIATTALGESWFQKRRLQTNGIKIAA